MSLFKEHFHQRAYWRDPKGVAYFFMFLTILFYYAFHAHSSIFLLIVMFNFYDKSLSL